MSKRRPERRVCVALVSALTAALFCVPVSDAVANTRSVSRCGGRPRQTPLAVSGTARTRRELPKQES